MNKAYIGIGGNLGGVIATIKSAIAEIELKPHTNLIELSSFYFSKPLSEGDQPQYINAVMLIETQYAPLDLLDFLQEIEIKFGRVRTHEQWASRTLDLDILLYNDLVITTDRLIIPHTGILARDFVLIPLYEIAPDLTIPNLGLLSVAVTNCENRGLEKRIEAF